MKIVIIPSWINSPGAPSRGSFITAQARGLSQRGHDVTVIAPDRDLRDQLFKIAESVEDGMRYLRVAVPSPWHRLIGFYAPQLLASVLRQNIKRISPDVVHAHAVRPAGVLAELAMRDMQIPWCITEHSSPLRAFWWTRHGKRQIENAYAGSNRLYAVSESLRSEMVQYFGETASKTTILFNGIDTDLFAMQPPTSSLSRLLFVGGLEPKKGLSILFEALSMLPPSLAWRLTVVGKGRLEGRLRKEAVSLRINDRIHWVGSVAHNEMPQVYAEHDALVLPSLHETFGLVCAEALACGRPVISTQCGGPEEVVPPFGGMLVPPSDAVAFSDALKVYLSGEFQFNRQSAALHIENNFSMSALLDRLEVAYANLSAKSL